MRYILAFLITIVLNAVAVGYACAAQEYKVTAGYLLNFAKYIEYPAESLPGSHFTICVIGSGEAADSINLLKNKQVGTRFIDVKVGLSGSEVSSCNIIFIPQYEKDQITTTIKITKNKPILLVSEIDGFIQKGGVINMFMEGSKLRFDINLAVARKSHLQISSQLIKIAHSILE